MALTAVSIEANAVIMITGRSSSTVRTASSTCRPSISGIIMSVMTASNGIERARSSPSRPEAATRTV